MNMPLCARCKKNLAVVFITKMENGKTTNEGICLKCARELGIKPVSDLMDKFGITDEDVENMAGELTESGPEMLSGLFGTLRQDEDAPEDDPEEEQPSRAPTFPFFNAFNQGATQTGKPAEEDTKDRKPKEKKKKFLTNYALNLTQRAKEGRLDPVIGRERETLRVVQILNRRQKKQPLSDRRARRRQDRSGGGPRAVNCQRGSTV